jgi:hypothetical protein
MYVRITRSDVHKRGLQGRDQSVFCNITLRKFIPRNLGLREGGCLTTRPPPPITIHTFSDIWHSYTARVSDALSVSQGPDESLSFGNICSFYLEPPVTKTALVNGLATCS